MADASIPYDRIDGLTRRQQFQIYEDFKAVMAAAGGGGGCTITIAPSDARASSKKGATYVCNGTNDATILQTAVTLLTQAGGGGGRICIMEGTINLGSTQITASLSHSNELVISGQGPTSTTITGTHATSLLVASGGSRLYVDNLGLVNTNAAGAAIQATTSPITIHDCYLEGFRGFYGLYGVGGQGSVVYDNDVKATGTNSRGIQFFGGAGDYCVNNRIEVSGAGIGIRMNSNGLGYDGQAVVNDNYVFQTVRNSSAIGIWIGWNFFDNRSGVLCQGNKVWQFGTGIQLDGGHQCAIMGNLVYECNMGIETGPSGSNTTVENCSIIGNTVAGTTGSTAHIRLQNTGGSCYNVVVAFNKLTGVSPTVPVNAIVVASGVSNAAVYYNDTFGAYSGAALSDSGTSTRTESTFATLPLAHESSHLAGGSDELIGNLNAIARHGVRKNSTGSTYQRRRLNLIEGSGVTITIADDSVDEEVDVTIAASGGGGGGGAATSNDITQTAHGLAVGNVVRYSGTAYVKAKADSGINAEVVGIVSAVADADNFTLITEGLVTGLSGLSAGTTYYLDPSTAGALSASEPGTVGQISKPLLIAVSTTQGYFFNFRGSAVASGGTGAASNSAMFNWFAFR